MEYIIEIEGSKYVVMNYKGKSFTFFNKEKISDKIYPKEIIKELKRVSKPSKEFKKYKDKEMRIYKNRGE